MAPVTIILGQKSLAGVIVIGHIEWVVVNLLAWSQSTHVLGQFPVVRC